MPEAVSQYVRKRDLLNGDLVLNDHITVPKTDFAKYRKRTPHLLLNEVFESVMRQTGGKFVYEHAASGTPAAAVRQALELLIMAVKKSELYSGLWASCDSVRTSNSSW
jgi:hypothetical protein